MDSAWTDNAATALDIWTTPGRPNLPHRIAVEALEGVLRVVGADERSTSGNELGRDGA